MGLHAVLLGLLALGGGVVKYHVMADENAVHIDLVRPLIPPPPPRKAAAAQRAQALPIQPRPTPVQPTPSPVQPLPFAPVTRPPGTGGGNPPGIGVAPHSGSQPPGLQANTRGALRSSVFACANADAVGLNRAEREACDVKMGNIGLAAQARGAAIDPNKRAAWDYDAAKAAAKRRKRDGQMPGGLETNGGGPEAKDIPW
ncbi:MAG: hypothetical protein JWP35_4132 [Caulobacter sp.]|nr:hypothetical protein [Caulobacter sp.]